MTAAVSQAYERALNLHRSGNLQGAAQLYQQILTQQPEHAGALHMLGVVALGSGALADAQRLLRRAVQLLPQDAGAHVNLALALAQSGEPGEALTHIDQALSLQPQMPAALMNRVAILLKLGQNTAAERAAAELIAAGHQHPELRVNHGIALLELQRPQEAIAAFDIALQAAPRHLQALNHLAKALIQLRQYERAIAQVEKALAIDPQNTTAYLSGGQALAGMGRHADAIANFDKALSLAPDLHAAHYAKAASEIDLKRFQAAIRSLEACHTDPAIVQPVRMQVCDWSGFEDSLHALHATAVQAKRNPFPFLGMVDDPRLHLDLARAHLELLKLPQTVQRDFGTRRPGRIRVGYFSADYFEHATMHLMAELFESHARDQFEIHAFSMGPQVNDAMRERVTRNVDGFHDISGLTDQAAAARARELNIDIAVDLKGFTRDGRLGIFADRCAPVQVSYLGYPGTTGADFMDYVIADTVVLPPEQQHHYTEQAVYMPHSYQVNNSARTIAERVFTRTELGLPTDSFVFCCFNNNYKILPSTFASWMRIMQAVPSSVLWLFQDNDDAARNLVREAEQRGVDGQRLVFAQRMPFSEHLARHRTADLFIDTLPCNAHTTASDALWAGLPVLTLAGQSFAGRVAASLLTAIGLPELITHTPQDYEARAIHLATHHDELAALRAKLAELRNGSPLFDGKRFTRHLESAYRTMVERREAGQPPMAFAVQDVGAA